MCTCVLRVPYPLSLLLVELLTRHATTRDIAIDIAIAIGVGYDLRVERHPVCLSVHGRGIIATVQVQ